MGLRDNRQMLKTVQDFEIAQRKCRPKMPDLPNIPVDTDGLLKWLDERGFETQTYHHEAVFTVGESQAMRESMEGGHTKNLFLKDKKDNYFLLTAEEDSEVNLKTLHKLLGGSSRFSFGKPEKMQDYLGVAPGAVTAFGIVNDRGNKVTFAIDERLMRHDMINCHPLTNEATTTIKRSDLIAFAEECGHPPMVVDLDAET